MNEEVIKQIAKNHNLYIDIIEVITDYLPNKALRKIQKILDNFNKDIENE